eukprot:PhF_6_TR8679/c0_g1_i2/m.13589
MSEAEISEISKLSEQKLFVGAYREAVELRLQAIKITETLYGKKHPHTISQYYDLSKLCLKLAENHLEQHSHDDATRYLLHVDTLTQTPIDDPVHNRFRLVLRARLLNAYTKLRTGQRKPRQALNYAKKYLELVRRLNLLLEAPQAYLNVCAVLSSLSLHDEALAHAYLALQHLNRIIHAVEHPRTTTIETIAIKMQQADEAGDTHKAYRYFEMSLTFGTNQNNQQSVYSASISNNNHHSTNLNVSPIGGDVTSTMPHVGGGDVAFNIDSLLNDNKSTMETSPSRSLQNDFAERQHLEGLHMLLSAIRGNSITSPGKRPRCPALQFIGTVVSQSGGDVTFQPTKEMRSKWGGTMAMVYHSIGVQQEYLGQGEDSLKTYRVAHATAVQYLGSLHPLTARCKDTVQKAQVDLARKAATDSLKGPSQSMSSKQSNVSMLTRARTKASLSSIIQPTKKPSTAPEKMQRVGTSPTTLLPSLSNNNSGSPPSTSQAQTKPMWNSWHSSKYGPPRHLVIAQERQDLRDRLKLTQSRELLRSRCEALNATFVPTKVNTDDGAGFVTLDGMSRIDTPNVTTILNTSTEEFPPRPATRQARATIGSRGTVRPVSRSQIGQSQSSFLMSEEEFEALDEDVALNAPEYVWTAHMMNDDHRSTTTHVKRVKAIQEAHDRWARKTMSEVSQNLSDSDVVFLKETYQLPGRIPRPRPRSGENKMFNDFERFRSSELDEARRMAQEAGIMN